MENNDITSIPENFRNIINDFICDLSTTFPEYSHLWLKWGSPDLPESELEYLFEYLREVFPERFFDILYQNDDIFKPSSEVNTCFLPDIDFKILFNCENVSDTTHKALWKYMQLILFTIVNSVKDKTNFGDAANLFDGIDENELHEKLQETMNSISSFFSNISDNKQTDTQDTSYGTSSNGTSSNSDDQEDFMKSAKNVFENMSGMPGMDEFQNTFDFKNMSKNMPDPAEIHQHLKGIFDGKIGQLAKEMAEEISDDITGLFKEEGKDIKTTEDVLKHLMKDPTKMMDLMKTVSSKLKTKMSSGEISQDELMKEASEMVGKMKGMGAGNENFDAIFKNLAKQMGGMGGMAGLNAMANMGGLGKNARVDTNAMNNMMKKMSLREKMKERMEKKRELAIKQALLNPKASLNSKASLNAEKTPTFSLQQTNENAYVFTNGETQEKSFAKPEVDIDTLVAELGLTNDDIVNNNNNNNNNNNASSKKKKKNKGKK
jgi:hypothetical protein